LKQSPECVIFPGNLIGQLGEGGLFVDASATFSKAPFKIKRDRVNDFQLLMYLIKALFNLVARFWFCFLIPFTFSQKKIAQIPTVERLLAGQKLSIRPGNIHRMAPIQCGAVLEGLV